MKPIKPKKMPKSAEEALALGMNTVGIVLTARQCRDVLAALEFERQQREKIAALIRAMFDDRVLDPYPTSDGSYEYQLREMVGWRRDDEA